MTSRSAEAGKASRGGRRDGKPIILAMDKEIKERVEEVSLSCVPLECK